MEDIFNMEKASYFVRVSKQEAIPSSQSSQSKTFASLVGACTGVTGSSYYNGGISDGEGYVYRYQYYLDFKLVLPFSNEVRTISLPMRMRKVIINVYAVDEVGNLTLAGNIYVSDGSTFELPIYYGEAIILMSQFNEVGTE